MTNGDQPTGDAQPPKPADHLAQQAASVESDPVLAQAVSAAFRPKRQTWGVVVGGVLGGVVLAILLAWFFGGSPGAAGATDDTSQDTPGRDTSPAPNPAAVAKARQAALLRRADEAVASNDPSFCVGAVTSSAQDACRALVDIGHNGRSTPADRKALRDYLHDNGYHRVYGYIVAKVDDGLYEAAYLRATYFGALPSQKHFLLKTTLTEYSSKGRFSLWALDLGTQQITTKDGFDQQWQVYGEVPFGSAIQQVFRAPAGLPTSTAAQGTLEALVSTTH